MKLLKSTKSLKVLFLIFALLSGIFIINNTAMAATKPCAGCEISQFGTGLNTIKLFLKPYHFVKNDKKATHYQIFYSKNKNMSGKQVKTVRTGEKYYFIKGLSEGTEYYIETRGFYKKNGKKIYSGKTIYKNSDFRTSKKTLNNYGADWKFIERQMPKAKLNKSVLIDFKFGYYTSYPQICAKISELESLHPDYFNMSNTSISFATYGKNNYVGIYFRRNRSLASAQNMTDATNAKVNVIVNKAKKFSSQKEQVESVNDEIVKLCDYEKDKKANMRYSAYGALVKKKANCNGYSDAFFMCMKKLNIPCRFQVNKECDHVWNKVQVNGKWTNIDVTWNDDWDTRKFIWLSDAQIKKYENHNF